MNSIFTKAIDITDTTRNQREEDKMDSTYTRGDLYSLKSLHRIEALLEAVLIILAEHVEMEKK